jgi:hypothetical protein
MQRIPSSHLPAAPRGVVRIERAVVIRSDDVGGVSQDASSRLYAPCTFLVEPSSAVRSSRAVEPSAR